MKAKIIIDDKEYEIELSEKQVKEIEKQSKKRWRAQEGEKYYSVYTDGIVYCYTELNDVIDNFYYITGNYFKTKKEAEEYKKKLLYQQQYKDYVNEHNKCEIDWGNFNQCKYYASLCHTRNRIIVNNNYTSQCQGIVYVTSQQIIKDFIKEIGEDNFKKYILEVDE